MAIVWDSGDAGDDPVPPHWNGLGADSTLPYDNGTIGTGELEGSVRESLEPLPSGDPNYSLEDALTGQDASALVQALDVAVPGERLEY